MDNIFKVDGMGIVLTQNPMLVTCTANHLTAFGVEEYTADIVISNSNVIGALPNITTTEQQDDVKVDMWKSWAIFTSIGLILVTPLALLWAYRKDKIDKLNMQKVRDE